MSSLEHDAVNKDTRICFVGDSFVNGTCDPDHLGWAGRICAESAKPGQVITCYNLGVRGDTSVDISSRWKSECTRRFTDVSDNRLVFSYGVNDCVLVNGQRRVPVSDSLAYSENTLREAASLYEVVFIGSPPIDDESQNQSIAELDRALQQLCDTLDIPCLSLFDYLHSQPAWMQEVAANDGAHPGKGGYRLIADYIMDWEGWNV